jgi:uncharacterized protein YjeT (DUF2065 family)
MTLKEGLFLAWALICVLGGLRNVLAPEKAIRSRHKWADRYARWMTLGLRRKAFGPFLSHETDLRMTFWGGVVLVLAGSVALIVLVVRWVA